jgi:hypothetical protein
VSNHALNRLTTALRRSRNQLGTRWRRLTVGRQALLVIAHLRKGETYTDLAAGFGIGTTTAFRYIREAIDALAAQAPTLEQAIEIAARKAFVILDGTLLRIDRIGMASGQDRRFYSGEHKCHGVNVQVISDPMGRLIWASPALPGARHDMGAAREHASSTPWPRLGRRCSSTTATAGRAQPSTCPSDGAARTPTPGNASGCHRLSARSTPPTPPSEDRASAPTQS